MRLAICSRWRPEGGVDTRRPIRLATNDFETDRDGVVARSRNIQLVNALYLGVVKSAADVVVYNEARSGCG